MTALAATCELLAPLTTITAAAAPTAPAASALSIVATLAVAAIAAALTALPISSAIVRLMFAAIIILIVVRPHVLDVVFDLIGQLIALRGYLLALEAPIHVDGRPGARLGTPLRQQRFRRPLDCERCSVHAVARLDENAHAMPLFHL